MCWIRFRLKNLYYCILKNFTLDAKQHHHLNVLDFKSAQTQVLKFTQADEELEPFLLVSSRSNITQNTQNTQKQTTVRTDLYSAMRSIICNKWLLDFKPEIDHIIKHSFVPYIQPLFDTYLHTRDLQATQLTLLTNESTLNHFELHVHNTLDKQVIIDFFQTLAPFKALLRVEFD